MSVVFWVETPCSSEKNPDDSEAFFASVFRAEEYAKQDTNRNRQQALKSPQLKRSASC
jgi:hypothetical protein